MRITFAVFTVILSTLPAVLNSFQLGSERIYAVENYVLMTDLKNTGTDVEYQVTGSLRVGAIWGNDEQKLLRFELISPAVHFKTAKRNADSEFMKRASALDSSQNKPFFAVWQNGEIAQVFISNKEDIGLKNLKKALVNLFQYQIIDGQTTETDVAGTCPVTYQILSPKRFIKTKENCKGTQTDSYRSRTTEPLGVTVADSVRSDYAITQEGILEKVESAETVTVSLNANKNAGNAIKSIINLKFDGSISTVKTLDVPSIAAATNTLKGLNADNLLTTLKSKCKGEECKSIVKLVKDNQRALGNENVGKSQLGIAMLKLLPAARTASREDLTRILMAHTTQSYRGQLADLLAAAQTKESYEAAKKVFDFYSEKDFEHSERFIQSLAVGAWPQEYVIADLIEISKNKFETDKMHDSIVQTIASMAFRYASRPGMDHQKKIVSKVERFLSKALKECTEIPCKVMYIRALNNLKDPKTIPSLMGYARTGETEVSLAAMKALRRFSTALWTENEKKQFQDIFFETKKPYDSSCRALALDILLSLRPNKNEVKDLLAILKKHDKDYELKKYLMEKLRMAASGCAVFEKHLKSILHGDPMLNNYHTVGQKGLTTVLSRPFSTKPSFNSTLLSTQEVYNGVLKRGIVDLTVFAEGQSFDVFSLELSAAGLSSFVSGSEQAESSQEDETPTAGMAITVQGALLRPLEFFRGQSELIGHVWSGTATDPTPAYQGTTILQDHKESVRLQNGAIVTISIQGAMSIDLKGEVQMSLWNKNAHSKVQKNSGIAVIGQVDVTSTFAGLASEFTITTEPELSLVSNIDFYSDISMCMRLSQPNTVLRHTIEKTETISNRKTNRKVKNTITYRLSGITHALNQKNNEMCNKIFPS